MKSCALNSVMGIVGLLLFVLTFTACAGSGANRGPLSDAMKKSHSEDPKDREIRGVVREDEKDEEETPEYPADHWQYAPTATMADSVEYTEDTGEKVCVGLHGSGGTTWSTGANGYFGAGVDMLWHYDENPRKTIGFSLGVEGMHSKTMEVEDDTHGAALTTFDIGLKGRKYLTPDYTLFGGYLQYGFGLKYLMWNYDHPLHITDYDTEGNLVDSETVSCDGLWGIDLHGGLGADILKTDKALVSSDLILGLTIWGPETTEGFSNDYFKPFLYLRIEFSVLFLRN